MAPYSIIWFAAGTIMLGMRFWLRLRGHAGRLGLDDVWLHGTFQTPETKLTPNRLSYSLAGWPD